MHYVSTDSTRHGSVESGMILSNHMLISGIQPFTLLDYPEKIACVVFTPGCNFRCGFCHNPEFVLPEKIIELKNSFIPERSFFQFLAKRKGLLDGVVISGGEPTLAADLLGFMGQIKALGLFVKLDTNGNRPEVLEKAVSERLVDYIAMDVKTSLTEYRALVGPLVSPEKIKKSIETIKGSGVDYEFRTTLIKEVHSDIILKDLTTLVAGARRWSLQTFRSEHTLESRFEKYHSFPHEEIKYLIERIGDRVEKIILR